MEKDLARECVVCKGRYDYNAGGDPLFCTSCKQKMNRPERRRIEKMIRKIRGQ